MKHTDINFPTEDAIAWKEFGESGYLDTANITWKRISDPTFPSHKFWGDDGTDSISVEDIRQGGIGNCWLMAAISALAEDPARVDKIMISDDIEPAGIYAMNMYSLGIPFTQIIDDWMPMVNNHTIYGRTGRDGSIWAAVAEKMFAKWYGNYEHL